MEIIVKTSILVIWYDRALPQDASTELHVRMSPGTEKT